MNRKVVSFLFWAFTLFTVYNTLIPFSFDYGFGDLAGQIGKINWKMYWGEDIAITDIVGNIILFMPFGFLLYMKLQQDGSNHPILIAILSGAALSLSIEITQLFIQSRDTAPHDLLNNTLGSFVGAAVASIYSASMAATARRTFYDLLDRKPFILLAVIIALSQFVTAVMPFTVSISVSSLADSVKESNVIPFTYMPIGTMLFGYHNEKTEYRITPAALDSLRQDGVPEEVLAKLANLQEVENSRRSRFLNEVKRELGGKTRDKYRRKILRHAELPEQQFFQMSKWLESLIYWIAVGYILMICYRIYWKKKPYGNAVLYGLPLLYFLFLEGFPLIITSRISDINDIISGYGGVLAGIGLYHLLKPIRRAGVKRDIDLLKIPLVFYFVFIFFAGFRPFDWSLAAEVINKDLIAENLIPFYAYFRKTNLWNMYDLVSTMAYFVPISLFWSYVQREKGQAYSQIYTVTIIAGLVVGAIVEFSQLLSFERIAEITDVLAYGTGGAIGTFLVYYYHHQIIPTLKMVKQGTLRL